MRVCAHRNDVGVEGPSPNAASTDAGSTDSENVRTRGESGRTGRSPGAGEAVRSDGGVASISTANVAQAVAPVASEAHTLSTASGASTSGGVTMRDL